MTRTPVTDPETESGLADAAGRAPWTAAGALRWAAAGAAAAAAACAVGRRLPVILHWGVGFDDTVAETAPLMAGLGGLYGLVVGGAAGLLFAGPKRLKAALARAFAWALVGAVAGGLGPLLVARTDGQLPTGVGVPLGCGFAGGLAGLVAYTWRRERAAPAALSDEDWAADPNLAGRPGPAATGPASAVRQWPILAVSSVCLLVAIVTPPSPAGWPMIGIALLGFAVAWAVAGQERRLRELEQRLRQGEAIETDPGPGDRPGG